jgi:Arc/MetJ-type ribon-helix-helix transcriptional regulator
MVDDLVIRMNQSGWYHEIHELAMQRRVGLPGAVPDWVRQKVASGHYSSASEVVREALRLMEREDQIQAANWRSCGVIFRRVWIAARPGNSKLRSSSAVAARGSTPQRRTATRGSLAAGHLQVA